MFVFICFQAQWTQPIFDALISIHKPVDLFSPIIM